jgi:hypothetical protein
MAVASTALQPTIHAIRVVPVANAAPSFPSAAALASAVSVAEGAQTTVPLTITGGSGAGSVEVYYTPSGSDPVLFGTAVITGTSVGVSGAFRAAGTYQLSARTASRRGRCS